MAQRRAAEAEAKAQAGAAEAETQAQADAGAYEADEAGADEAGAYEADAGAYEAEAQAQADARAYEAQLHQLQPELQQREQQATDTQRLQHLQQQLQDLQQDELQRKEQQVAEQQQQLQQQQADMHLMEQQLAEQQHQLQQQQADMQQREQHVLGGIMVESLRPVLASTKPAPGGQRTTQQQPFNTALAMTMGTGIEQHGIKRTARQLGITPHAVKRARRSHLSNLAAGAAADWAAAPLRRGRRCLSQDQLEYVRNFFEEHSSPSPMYKDVRRYYVRMTAGSSKKSEVRMSRRYVDRSLKKLYLEYEREYEWGG
ncbi:hypothetical protein QJQ45_025865 [Haematococcus lacustris]|nr:hypothetical protein QJQ45_025865 [Haematococcus lacustris]